MKQTVHTLDENELHF